MPTSTFTKLIFLFTELAIYFICIDILIASIRISVPVFIKCETRILAYQGNIYLFWMSPFQEFVVTLWLVVSLSFLLRSSCNRLGIYKNLLIKKKERLISTASKHRVYDNNFTHLLKYIPLLCLKMSFKMPQVMFLR